METNDIVIWAREKALEEGRLQWSMGNTKNAIEAFRIASMELEKLRSLAKGLYWAANQLAEVIRNESVHTDPTKHQIFKNNRKGSFEFTFCESEECTYCRVRSAGDSMRKEIRERLQLADGVNLLTVDSYRAAYRDILSLIVELHG